MAHLELARFETRLAQMEQQMADHRSDMHRELEEARSMTPMRHDFATPAQFDFSGNDLHPDTEALHKAGLEIAQLEKELAELRLEVTQRNDENMRLQGGLPALEQHNRDLEEPGDFFF